MTHASSVTAQLHATAQTGVTLSIPALDGRPALGTWEGVHLSERRLAQRLREVMLHLLGE